MLLVTASAAVLSLLVASAGEAITISGVVVSTNPGDSGYSLGTFGDYGSDSATSVTNSGGFIADAVGASVAAGTRYAQYTWADRDTGFTTLNTTSDYSVVLQITPDDPNSVYDIQINTTRLGALTLIDDSASWDCCGTATIGAVTADVDGVTDPTLAMAGASITSPPPSGGLGDSALQDINQASSTTIVGLSGNHTLELDFAWTAQAYSYYDEASVRLGLSEAASGVTVNDYPGIGSRTEADDGHFVNITATVTSVIPEPASALLLGLGLVGLSARRSLLRLP